MNFFKNSSTILLGLCLISFAIFYSCNEAGSEMEEGETAEEGSCPKPMAWLSENPIPEPDYNNFPCGYTVNDDGSVTNRAFHEVSWQYFLWLTEDVKGVPRFETFYNDASINLDDDDKNARTHILGGIQQAGSSSIVVDENGRAVYTSMMIDDIYHDFVKSNKLNETEALRNFDPTTDFPNGSMSLKASWKIIPDGQQAPKGAYTREAELYTVVNIDGNLTTSDNYTDPAKHETFKAKVALVGFHIAVVVKDHPEFIWATFEHNNNAPDMFDKNATEPSRTTSPDDATFYKANTDFKYCNVSNLGALQVDEESQKITGFYGVDATTNIYRRYEYGGGNETNQNNIEDLNKQVRDALPNNSWAQNYYEVGAVWFDLDIGSLVPNWSLTANPNPQTGSKTLSNATIETFTQDPDQQNSCFSCHNTMSYNPYEGVGIEGKNVLTSHILLKNYINQMMEGEEAKVLIDRK